MKNGVRIERDIPYVPDGDASQRLDLYLPEKSGGDRPLPLLVWVHGGGWLGGSKSENPGAALTARGEYASASVEYRFSDKALFPAQIQDCQAAVRFLRANAKKYHIDPDRIGVWGGSAGGHLVALLGTAGGADAFPKIGENRDQSDRVQAVIDIFGPADFPAVKRQVAADKAVKNIFNFEDMSSPYAKLFGAVSRRAAELEKSASPVTFVSKDDPPFLIVHGTADTLVPYAQSTEFADALKKAGVDVILQTVPGGGHGGPGVHVAGGEPAVQELLRQAPQRRRREGRTVVGVGADHAATRGGEVIAASPFLHMILTPPHVLRAACRDIGVWTPTFGPREPMIGCCPRARCLGVHPGTRTGTRDRGDAGSRPVCIWHGRRVAQVARRIRKPGRSGSRSRLRRGSQEDVLAARKWLLPGVGQTGP